MTAQKVAVVTAWGNGIGAATAHRLAQDGFRVAIHAACGKAEAIGAEVGGFGVTGSNRSKNDLTHLIDRTLDAWGRIDVVVNSSGPGVVDPIVEQRDEDWSTGMYFHLVDAARLTRLVTPVMQKQKSGTIINVSNFDAFEFSPASDVFRAAVAAFTELFADKYAAEKIRMNSILPGLAASLPVSLPEKFEFQESIPEQRDDEIAKITDVISLLASDGIGYVTGQSIQVVSGLTQLV